MKRNYLIVQLRKNSKGGTIGTGSKKGNIEEELADVFMYVCSRDSFLLGSSLCRYHKKIPHKEGFFMVRVLKPSSNHLER